MAMDAKVSTGGVGVGSEGAWEAFREAGAAGVEELFREASAGRVCIIRSYCSSVMTFRSQRLSSS